MLRVMSLCTPEEGHGVQLRKDMLCCALGCCVQLRKDMV